LVACSCWRRNIGLFSSNAVLLNQILGSTYHAIYAVLDIEVTAADEKAIDSVGGILANGVVVETVFASDVGGKGR
jgi:hypothetical protein